LLHGVKVREEIAGQSRDGDAQVQARHAQERVGQEGDEPQTGHRHRTVGSAARRRKGAGEKVVVRLVEEVFVLLFEEVAGRSEEALVSFIEEGFVIVEEVLRFLEESFVIEEVVFVEEVLFVEEVVEEEVGSRVSPSRGRKVSQSHSVPAMRL
jgi:hypothetical protein